MTLFMNVHLHASFTFPRCINYPTQNINYHSTFKVNINTVGIQTPDIHLAEPFKWLTILNQGSECPLFEWLSTIQMPFEYRTGIQMLI